MTEKEKDQELTHRRETLKSSEKPFYKSKKFLAWLIQQLIMGSMAITALIKQPSLGWPLAAFMGGLVFMMGVSTMWYLGKQAAADIAVRGYAMVGKVAGLAGSAIGKPSSDDNAE